MQFTDNLIETAGAVPVIKVRYLRETMGQSVYIHGFNGLKVERVAEPDGKIRYEKIPITYKPAVINAKGEGEIDDTPENRIRIAKFVKAEEFAISQEDWKDIDGDAILGGAEAKVAPVVEKAVDEAPTKIKKKKGRVSSKKIENSEASAED